MLERETEGLALSGDERSGAEVDGVGIRAGGLENANWDVFGLGDLADGIFEFQVDNRMGHGFVAGVGESAVEIGNAGADEILRSAHLEVGNLQIGGVRMRCSGAFGFAAQKESDDSDHDHDRRYAQKNGAPIRLARRGSRRWLNQTTHGGIVDGLGLKLTTEAQSRRED